MVRKHSNLSREEEIVIVRKEDNSWHHGRDAAAKRRSETKNVRVVTSCWRKRVV